jgi:two-component system, cell cycle sensor histidine kinase and response regulator CckA
MPPKSLQELREQASKRIAEQEMPGTPAPSGNTAQIVQELKIYQIELELQNEELREAQREVSLSRDRYLELYHHAPVGYVIANEAGIVLQSNETLGHMLATEIAAILNRPLTDFIIPTDRPLFLSRYRPFFKNPHRKRLEIELLKSDGSSFHGRLAGRRMGTTGALATDRQLAGQLMISISDITAQKTAERAIINAKKQWEQTFDAVPDLVVIIDHHQTVKRVNRAFATRLKRSPQECIGQDFGGIVFGSCENRDAQKLNQVLDEGKPMELSVFCDPLDAHFLLSVSPFPVKKNQPPWQILVFHDITARIRAEKELRKSRNLESIGALAGGIAHDFNNILVSIVGNIELAQIQAGDADMMQASLKRAIEASERAKALTSRLLTFSQGGAPRPSPTDVRTLIEETAAVTLKGTENRVAINLEADLKPVMADDIQVRIVLQSILRNAIEAMPAGGCLTIGARNLTITESNNHVMKPGAYVEILIGDEGRGIRPENLDKVFDPYFTTKRMGPEKGMGLGLAITYSIVKQHGGRVTIQSEWGRGTVAKIFLPSLAESQKTDRESAVRALQNSPGMPRFLVMEDEVILWEMMHQMMGSLNCSADFAANGAETLTLFRKAKQEGRPYTALLLDLTIRGSSEGGREVVKKILAIDPTTKAVAFSGYTNDPIFSDYQRYGFIASLAKPFKLKDMKRIIRQMVSATQ